MKYLSLPIISALAFCFAASASEPAPGFSLPLQWRVGAEVAPAWVPGTNGFLDGENRDARRIDASLSAALRADFSFSPASREGMLYRGLYQGVGVGPTSYFSGSLLGTPVSAYVYQGAPIARLSSRLTLGYEWQFGAAFGWKHYDAATADDNGAVSTSVTAHMGLGLKLRYGLSDHWQVSFGIAARHFSNGNTTLPNAGVNDIGASIGIAYAISPVKGPQPVDADVAAEADRRRWLYDIMAYGAWRRRVVSVGDPAEQQLCPDSYPVAGLMLAPMRALNRWVAVGPSLDLQWDHSAGLEPYWVEGTQGDDIQFYRPAFGKQVSVGLSAHAELTMPIFTVNVGLGYAFVRPEGEKAFYQMLSLKTFLTRHLYLNTGYRLGNFKDPQNLLLGLGLRL